MPNRNNLNSIVNLRPLVFIFIALISGCSNLPDGGSEGNENFSSIRTVEDLENNGASDLIESSVKPSSIDQSTNTETSELSEESEPSLIERATAGFTWGDYSEQEQVDYWITRYANSIDQFSAVLGRAEPYLFYILEQLEAHNLPSEIAFLPFVESGYRPDAASWIGASGLWQFMPATGKYLGLEQDWWTDQRRSVDQSTDAAIEYLQYLHNYFDEDWFLALAAYNTGEGNLRRAIRNNGGEPDFWSLSLSSETTSYIPKLLAVVHLISNPEEFQLELPTWANEAYFEIYETERQLDLDSLADHLGLEIQQILALNAQYPQKITSPNQSARIALPSGFSAKLDSVIEQLPEASTAAWAHYLVRSGDNLSLIADRMGVRVTDIQEANQLRSTIIHPGDDLLIPNPGMRLTNQSIRSEVATVREGDSPWLIARRYGVRLSELLAANDLRTSDLIHPGQLLQLPDSSGGDAQITHEVQLGDSLYEIALHYGVALGELRSWNALGSSNLIHPGDQLTIWVNSGS